MNVRPVDIILDQLKQRIGNYACNYFGIYGYSPTKKHLENMVLSALDQFNDPKVRAQLRNGFASASVTPDHDKCAVKLGLRAGTVSSVNKYLKKAAG